MHLKGQRANCYYSQRKRLFWVILRLKGNDVLKRNGYRFYEIFFERNFLRFKISIIKSFEYNYWKKNRILFMYSRHIRFEISIFIHYRCEMYVVQKINLLQYLIVSDRLPISTIKMHMHDKLYCRVFISRSSKASKKYSYLTFLLLIVLSWHLYLKIFD